MPIHSGRQKCGRSLPQILHAAVLQVSGQQEKETLGIFLWPTEYNKLKKSYRSFLKSFVCLIVIKE